MSRPPPHHVHLHAALSAFGTAGFGEVLLAELEKHEARLPLLCSYGSDATKLLLTVISSRDCGTSIEAELSVEYTEYVHASCGPQSSRNRAWARLTVTIDKADSRATFEVMESDPA